MTRLIEAVHNVFNTIEAHWMDVWERKVVAWMLIVSFGVALLAIELSRQGLLPAPLGLIIPTNHFYAVDAVFTLFLAAEVVGLILGLATSVAASLGKQFEVFSLILLRQSFKELAAFGEPIAWTELSGPALRIISDATGAVLIFAALGVYYRMQQHRQITANEQEQYRFVAAKKLIALVLLAAFLVLGAVAGYTLVADFEVFPFFQAFYTVLVFTDVLIVLVSLRYSSTYHIVFRNSGFAVATVIIRLALAGPVYWNAILGVYAALFAIGLTWIYNRFAPVLNLADDELAAVADDDRQPYRPSS